MGAASPLSVLPGTPWPRDLYGAVAGPSGKRCYSEERAEEITGLSDRGLRYRRERGKRKKSVVVLDPCPGGKVFYLAESVEALAAESGRWPPEINTSAPVRSEEADPPDLGADESRNAPRDDSANEELVALQDRVNRLESDNRSLRRVVKSLNKSVKELRKIADRQG